VRFNVSSVFSPDSNITSDLPVQFLSFAGGEQSLRGFERESLPRGGVGALSAAIAGTEARLHKVLWKKADAFVFTDAGLLGGVSFSLAKPLFLSPGLGVRWESPIGVFRAYAAQRFAVMQEPGQEPYGRHWRLGLTYGEEF
jgi:outer membrane protein assembly factor BamA